MFGKVGSLLGEFGWIVQVVVGAVQGVALATSDALELHATKKYIREGERTQSKLHAALLANKRKEIEERGKVLGIKGQTELLRDQKVKKLVIMGVVTTIAVTLIALIVIYSIAKGGDDTVVVKLSELEEE